MWHLFLYVTGCDNLSGPWYGFWSGFAGCIPQFGALFLIWRKINCHAAGCPRVGLHKSVGEDGMHFVTCAKHRHLHNA